MGTASEALKKVLDVYEKILIADTRIGALERRFNDFQIDQRSERTAFESRLKGDLESFGRRLLELESRMAKTEGQVSGALAEAISVTFLNPERERLSAQLSNKQKELPAASTDGQHSTDGKPSDPDK